MLSASSIERAIRNVAHDESYSFDKGIDLNTATDEFTQIGQGNARLNYLREIDADNRGLTWISYYGSFNYSYADKYYLSSVLCTDVNSAMND